MSQLNKIKRIAVTGIGVVSSLGFGKEEFWASLLNKSLLTANTRSFDVGKTNQNEGFAKVLGFEEFLKPTNVGSYDRASKLVLSVANSAVIDSKFTINESNSNECGVSIGASFNYLESCVELNKQGLTESPRFVDPALFPNTVTNAPASRISIAHKIRGVNVTISNGCCSSIEAIKYGVDVLRYRHKSFMLVGGVESFDESYLKYFQELGIYFNRNISYFGEGSGVLTLESLDQAQDRNASIYCEIMATQSLCAKVVDKARTIVSCLERFFNINSLKARDIDVWLVSQYDDMILFALRKVLGKDFEFTTSQRFTGQTISASGVLDVIYGIGFLNQKFPFGVDVNRVVVVNVDYYGMCNVILLNRYER